MLRLTKFALSVSVLAAAAISTNLYALEPAFSIQQGMLKYGSESSKVKPSGGTTVTTDTSGLTTMPDSLLLYATMDKVAIYLTPTNEHVPFSVSYYVLPNLEVGLSLNLNSSTVEEKDFQKTETSDNSYGPFVTFYQEAGPLSLEIGYALTLGATTEKTTNKVTNTVKTESDQSGMSHLVSVLALYPLAKNLLYGFGFDYAMSNLEDNKAPTEFDETLNTSAKGKKATYETSGFNLNLATLRFNF